MPELSKSNFGGRSGGQTLRLRPKPRPPSPRPRYGRVPGFPEETSRHGPLHLHG